MFDTLKHAYDLAKDLHSLEVSTEFQTKISQLLGDLLTAREDSIALQDKNSTLLAEVRELKQQAAQRQDWLTEKQRYQLHRIEPGAAVYLLKPDADGDKTFHVLCAQCFDSGKKGYLQPTMKEVGWRVPHRCSCCSVETALDKSSLHELEQARLAKG